MCIQYILQIVMYKLQAPGPLDLYVTCTDKVIIVREVEVLKIWQGQSNCNSSNEYYLQTLIIVEIW